MWSSETEPTLPATLEEAHAEILRLRAHNEFRTKKETMIREVEENAKEIAEVSPTYKYVQKIPFLVNAEGCNVPLPTGGIVGLYFGIGSCPACKRFEPQLFDFLESNQDKGFSLIYLKPVGNETLPEVKHMFRLSPEHESIALELRKDLSVVFFPTLIIVDFNTKHVVTRYGREAVDAERISGQALASWKLGQPAILPSWFERKRKLSVNLLSMALWFVSVGAIMYFVFGFTFEATFFYWYNMFFNKSL